MMILEKIGCRSCKKCGKEFELGDIGWHNKHMNKYGTGCYCKWYCEACYNKMFI